jgi:hypothetical protein
MISDEVKFIVDSMDKRGNSDILSEYFAGEIAGVYTPLFEMEVHLGLSPEINDEY